MINLKLYFKEQELRRKEKQCWKAAFKICEIGFENGNAQKDLNDAKDLLYSAAGKFERKIKRMQHLTPGHSTGRLEER